MKEFKPEETLKKDVDLETIRSLPTIFLEDKVILGLDIYKYSQFPPIEQIYIPVIFDRLYVTAVSNTLKFEPYFFVDYAVNVTDFKKNFISTGDGGFQIFDNVIQALIFAMYFQILLKRYNTGGGNAVFEKNLHKLINSLEIRYAVSLDKVYSYKSNYYGPAIINNARILSKDSLNRLLIDLNSVTWLNNNINSTENLMDIDKERLSKTNFFKGYKKENTSRLFDTKGKVISVDLQKVGVLTAKENKLDVFNLHLQVKLDIKIGHQEYSTYVVTLGNLNTSGINP